MSPERGNPFAEASPELRIDNREIENQQVITHSSVAKFQLIHIRSERRGSLQAKTAADTGVGSMASNPIRI